MRLPEGWSEAEVLRCAAKIMEGRNWRWLATEAHWCAEILDRNRTLAASAVPADQGEKETQGKK